MKRNTHHFHPYNEQKSIQSKILHWVFPTKSYFPSFHYKKLPGPMPITIQRKNIHQLQNHQYWVTEKSDGERQMLLLDEKMGNMLINRKFQTKPYELPSCFKPEMSVLLDGEYFETTQTFLIFDIVMFNHQSIANEKFSIRLQKMETFVRETKLPTQIRLKTFYPRQKLDVLLQKMETMDDGRILFHSDTGETNECDGLIFVPENEPYLCHDIKLFKWKWTGMNTIDLLVESQNNDDSFALSAGGYQNQTVIITHVQKEDISFTVFPGQIVECNYDRTEGKWIVLNVREDKIKPNHITTVISTMETMIDNLTKEDLLAIALI